MITFKTITDIPVGFSGHCYCEENCCQYWLLPGRTTHRVDGPAIICDGGTKYWLQYGMRHRLDGPAIIYANGGTAYYYSGKLFETAEDFYRFPDVINHPKNILNKLNKILSHESTKI